MMEEISEGTRPWASRNLIFDTVTSGNSGFRRDSTSPIPNDAGCGESSSNSWSDTVAGTFSGGGAVPLFVVEA